MSELIIKYLVCSRPHFSQTTSTFPYLRLVPFPPNVCKSHLETQTRPTLGWFTALRSKALRWSITFHEEVFDARRRRLRTSLLRRLLADASQSCTCVSGRHSGNVVSHWFSANELLLDLVEDPQGGLLNQTFLWGFPPREKLIILWDRPRANFSRQPFGLYHCMSFTKPPLFRRNTFSIWLLLLMLYVPDLGGNECDWRAGLTTFYQGQAEKSVSSFIHLTRTLHTGLLS